MDPQTPYGSQPPVVQAPMAPGPTRQAPPPPPRRSGTAWVFLFFLFIGCPVVFVLGLVFGLIGTGMESEVPLQEKYHSLAEGGQDKIAIIKVEGTIMDGEGFVKQQIDRIRKDDSVKAVVLRIDSPGGTVTGSDYIHHHLVKLVQERHLPIVVSMGGMAASGGYYVAMAVGDTENSIFAEPTTWTGSVGVIIPHYNFSGLMEHFNVADDSIKSHPLKQIGSPTRPMTEQERAILQALVTDSFDRFKGIVQSGRPYFRDHADELDKVATGQVFSTNQAIANKLIDKEGFIEDAIDRVVELGGLDKEKVKAIEYVQPLSLSSLFSLAHAKAEPAGLDLSTFVELTSPKAWYISTWLPAMSQR